MPRKTEKFDAPYTFGEIRLIDWVAQFLCYWQDAAMLTDEAAKIIVTEVLKGPLSTPPPVSSFFPKDDENA
jgi:hypothetical protein